MVQQVGTETNIPIPHGYCAVCKKMQPLHKVRGAWHDDEFSGVWGVCIKCGRLLFEPRPVKYSPEWRTSFKASSRRPHAWLGSTPCPKCSLTNLVTDEDGPFIEIKCLSCGHRPQLLGA